MIPMIDKDRGASLAALLLLLLLAPDTTKNVANGQQQVSLAGPLWLHRAGLQISTSEPGAGLGGPQISAKLHQLLSERHGPTIRASSNYHDFQDIQLNETLEAWRLLRERAHDFAQDQAQLNEPELRRALELSNTSLACRSSLSRFFYAIRRLDAWAVKMWSASGNFPPPGIFDGSFTDLGSYRGCIDIQRPASPDNSAGRPLEYAANYCLVGFRPVVPSRQRFHQIFVGESANLTALFGHDDALRQVAQFAQYFHYFYWKTGICVPTECSARDVQLVARLVGRRLALMPAPVRCISRALDQRTRQELAKQAQLAEVADERDSLMIDYHAQLNQRQWISLGLIGGFFAVVLLATAWHALEIARDVVFTSKYSLTSSPEEDDDDLTTGKRVGSLALGEHRTNGAKLNSVPAASYSAKPGVEWTFKHWCFHYFSMITNGREFADTRVRSTEILCLHGLRAITMLWIVCVHTLQYNDWSGFDRAFENVASLRNPLVQPLINANHVVDNFFLMSGLLAAYTTWNANKGVSSNFSALKCLLSRYLRLTPQVLLISLAYILLPALGSGPFWHDMTHHAAKYCEKNWWVNLLHLQAFYREDEMCNLVGWWISVDMCYYVIALGLLWLMLNKRLKMAALATSLLLIYCTISTAFVHYTGRFTPNNIGSVPQVGEVWSEFVVDFVWSPAPHAVVFFLGLWLGHMLANRRHYHLVRRHSKLGWLLSVASLFVVNMSSRPWITGALDLTAGPQYVFTAYYIVTTIIWACGFGWIIVACHYGCAPSLNRMLSSECCIMLSKASFIIYLSHMLILRTFYGSQYGLLEVSITTIITMLVGMCFYSILIGVLLCIAFEGPCMKFQKFVLNSLKREQYKLPIAGSSYLYQGPIQSKERNNNNTNTTTNNNQGPQMDKRSLNLSQTGAPLLK